MAANQLKEEKLQSSMLLALTSTLPPSFKGSFLLRSPTSLSSLVSCLPSSFLFFYICLKHKTEFGLLFVCVFLGYRPAGVSVKQYVIGFLTTVAASAVYGFVLPLIELVYKKTKQPLTYSLVMEIQFVMCLFATLFCAVGMIVNYDFKVIPREARNYGLGERTYYVVLVVSAIMWQAFFFGSNWVSKLKKGVSLVLSLWGFVSYFYGEIKQAKKQKKKNVLETELGQTIDAVSASVNFAMYRYKSVFVIVFESRKRL
ncbi:purine permease [Trifolium repens]|nr:purine permease [Trifolium repens]